MSNIISKDEFIEKLYEAGWTSPLDAQHQHIEKLYNYIITSIPDKVADKLRADNKALWDDIHIMHRDIVEQEAIVNEQAEELNDKNKAIAHLQSYTRELLHKIETSDTRLKAMTAEYEIAKVMINNLEEQLRAAYTTIAKIVIDKEKQQ